MGNPIASLLAKVSPIGQMVQQATNMAKGIQSGNPLETLSQNDPRMKQVYEFINSNGGNAEQAFYALAKSKGINPNDFLNQVKSMIG